MEIDAAWGIPVGCVLTEGVFKDKRGGQHEQWDHDILDDAGRVVGKLSRWETSNIYGKPEGAGWKRYDKQGQLVVEGATLIAG